MAKRKGGPDIKQLLNYKNWGVKDYTDKGNFKSAFASAKKAGEDQFMWNNNRYTTRQATDPISDNKTLQKIMKENPNLLRYSNQGAPPNIKVEKDRNRPLYNYLTNTIKMGENPQDKMREKYLAELAHHKRRDIDRNSSLLKEVINKFRVAKDYGESEYYIPDTDEWETHRLTEPAINMYTLGNFSKDDVKKLQKYLSVKEDGILGSKTYKAIADKYYNEGELEDRIKRYGHYDEEGKLGEDYESFKIKKLNKDQIEKNRKYPLVKNTPALSSYYLNKIAEDPNINLNNLTQETNNNMNRNKKAKGGYIFNPKYNLGGWIQDTSKKVGKATGLKYLADEAGDVVGKDIRQGVKDVGEFTANAVGDYYTFTADTAMGVVGAGDVIQKDDYATKVGGAIGDVSSKYIAPVAGQIAANVVAPGVGGAALGAVQGGVGSVAPNEAQQNRQAAMQQQQQTAQAFNAAQQPQYQSQYTSPYQMPMGGIVPGTNAELEKGETYMTPQGVINQVPQGTPSHAQGGQDMRLPAGTQVLGELKNSSNEEYKALGRRLEKAYNNYKKVLKGSPTPLAKRTAEKNLVKVQEEYMNLMQEQEAGKSGGNGREYQEGGITGGPRGMDTLDLMGIKPVKQGLLIGSNTETEPSRGDILSGLPAWSFPQTQNSPGTFNLYPEMSGGFNANVPYRAGSTQTQQSTAQPSAGQQQTSPQQSSGLQAPSVPDPFPLRGEDINRAAPKTDFANFDQGISFDVSQETNPLVSMFSPEGGGNRVVDPDSGFDKFAQNMGMSDGNSLGTAIGTAAQFAPALYNIGKGLFGKEADTQLQYQENPYKQEILNAMRDRRYDVRPQLAQANIASRTAERNLRETAPSSAQYMANLAGIQGQETRSKAGIYANKENVENQYRQQSAQMMNQMGSREAQRRQRLQQSNLDRRLRAQGAQDRLISTGISQLGTGARGVMQDVQSRRNTEMMREAYNKYLPNYNVGESGNIQFNPVNDELFDTYWMNRNKNNR